MSPFSHGVWLVLGILFTLQLLLNVNGDEINSTTDHLSFGAEHQPHHSLNHSTRVSSVPAVDEPRPADYESNPSSTRASPVPSAQQQQKGSVSTQDHSPLLGYLLHSLLAGLSLSELKEPTAPATAQVRIIPKANKNFLPNHRRLLYVARHGITNLTSAEKSSKQISSRNANFVPRMNPGTRKGDQNYCCRAVPDHVHRRRKRSQKNRMGKHVGTDHSLASDAGASAHPSKDSSRPSLPRKQKHRRKTKTHRQQNAGKAPADPPQVLQEGNTQNHNSSGTEVNGHDTSIGVLANLSSFNTDGFSLTGHLINTSGTQGRSAMSLPDQQGQEKQHLLLEAGALHAAQDPSAVSVAMGSPVYLGLDGKPLNMTEFTNMLKENELRRQLNREAQWAYLCLVILICLMMLAMWCMGGLERCRYKPSRSANFSDSQYLMSVREVLKKKRQYLPMFNEPEWEEVLMCNRGTDP